MTCIVGLAMHLQAFQVSDRLISIAHRKRGLEPFSGSYNKSVVIVAEDSTLIVGFTGLAYLGNVATDDVIAHAALGITNRAARGLIMRTSHSPASGYLAVVAAIDALNLRLDRVAEHHALELAITGLRVSGRRRLEPVNWSAKRNRNTGRLSLRTAGTHPFRWDRGYTIQTAGQVDPGALDRFRINARDGFRTSPDEATTGMIELIRNTADACAGVGKDCMAIRTTISHDNSRDIWVRYFPYDDLGSNHAFTPWVVTPDITYSPAKLGGGPGGWTSGLVRFHAWAPTPSDNEKVTVSWGSAQQPPPPR